jgi:hypothetical protein
MVMVRATLPTAGRFRLPELTRYQWTPDSVPAKTVVARNCRLS